MGLNVTFASVNQDICLGVGAVPEAVADPFHLTELIQESFEELERLTVGDTPADRKTARRRTARKKVAKGKSSTTGNIKRKKLREAS